ncbi:MAG: hypothetical protein J3R72DRAFT_65688 [Linnemannia gamsii]|nr:MAG: hypothetical protein J3R72DRAFT_65688 [Linnemannia gamsii]
MLSRNQEGSPRNSRPATPPSGRPESIEIQGCTMPWLKQATRRMLGHPPKSRDRTVINALAAVQRGPAGIFFPGDYGDATSNSSAHTQKAFLKQAQTTFFFTHNVAAPTLWVALPPLRARFESTSQLGHCSDLLRRYLTTTTSTAIIVTPLDPVQQDLVQAFVQDKEEQSRVFGLVRKVVEEFVVDALKSSASISEVVLLGPGLDRDDYHKLLNSLIAEFKSATLLNIEPLRGLVHMIECAKPGCLVADDLVRILAILRTRLQYTHQQSTKHPYYLVLAISRLLDVMVEGKVKDLSRVTEYEPLSTLLTELSAHPDMRLKHQATYALQGLFHIPNDETRRGFVLRHAGNIAMGLLGVASVCRLDMSKVGEGAGQLGRCAADLHDIATKATEGGRSLHASGQDIMTSIRGGIFSGGQQLWYPALREAQEHIRNGRLADFNSLVFEAPCRRDAEFQWGICQLLGEIAIDPLLDIVVRQNAIDFLAQLYRDDTVSNPDKDIWTYILDLLRQIDDPPDSPVSSHARSQLQGLAMEGGTDKQIVYRDIMAGPFDIFPLKVRLSSPFSSLLLDRAQAIPEVDHTLSKLRDMRLKESTNDLYIPPQAKPTSRSGNDRLFPLMRNTLDFLASDCQVLLLLGDSGGGKSTFNLQLENTLWQSYKRDAPIPLHINLPTIDNPDQNMIAKRLQQLDFSEAQIQELKQQRQFIVICDGYDESQLNRNLYTTNQFNQAGQWSVKMVIACRIQYLGPDYRSRFQPNAERYQHQQQQQAADHFQESFIAPFSDDQIKEYVEQFVAKDTTVPDQQKWSAHDYMDKLLKINGLMELVSNPFLLSLTLRALPKSTSILA